MMKVEYRAVTLVLVLALSSLCWGGFVVDADLTDWGVVPFTDWSPDPGIGFEQTNNLNKYNANNYSEYYDFEALYLASDSSNYYIALVSSYPFSPLHWNGSNFEGGDGGDIFLDLWGTSPMSISPHGVVTGLDAAILVATAVETPGKVVTGTWRDTHYSGGWWPGEGYQGSPHVVDHTQPTTTLGWATVAIGVYDYGLIDGQWEGNTYVLEIGIPKTILPSGIRGVHVTQWCGNDSINLIVPAPGAMALAALGTAIAGLTRARRRA
ncbi:MAG: hypothetical protein QHH07_04020 [Sedimentisphaerales bacterium]|nr:hypothetical protein [Sedimentisphaerales bacterium]